MRLGNEMIRQLAQVSLTFAPIECDFCRPLLDKSADAAPRLKHARPLQFRIDLRDRVRVDFQFDRQLSHGRQLFANAQLSRGDCELNRSLELVVKRRRVLGVYVEHRIAVLYYDNRTSSVSKIFDRLFATFCSDRGI
jgi:hypothetical protein